MSHSTPADSLMSERLGGQCRPARGVWEALDCPLIVTLIVGFVYGQFIVARLDAHAWQPSIFVTAGDLECDATKTPPSLLLLRDSRGYDGQYYYRMAVQPFDIHEPDIGVPVDSPAYRYQRILYPFLSWMLAGGQIDLVPWSMILVNYGAVCCLAAAASSYAQGTGQHALWGLAFCVYPGLLLSLARDLTECLPAALVMWALVQLQRCRWSRASALLCAAILSRETSVLVAFSVLIDHALNGRRSEETRRWSYSIAPVAVFLVWKSAVTIWWATVVPRRLTTFLAPPGFGIFGGFVDAMSPLHGDRLKFIELLFVATWAALAIWSFPRTKAATYEKASLVLHGALALSLGPPMWIEDWGFLRLLTESYMFAVVVALRAPRRFGILLTAIWSLGLCLHLEFLKCL